MKKLFSDRSAWWSLFLEMVRVTIPLQFLLNILAWARSSSNPTFAPLSCPKLSRVWYSYCCYFSLYSLFTSSCHLSFSSSLFLLLLFLLFRVFFLLLCCCSNVCVEVSACMQTEAKKDFQCHCPPLSTLLLEKQLAISLRWLVSESRNPQRSHRTDIRGSYSIISHPDFVMWVLRIEVKLLRNYYK